LAALGDLPTARAHLERALAIREARLGSRHSLTLRTQQELAHIRAALEK
jgi:hypothetical protein